MVEDGLSKDIWSAIDNLSALSTGDDVREVLYLIACRLLPREPTAVMVAAGNAAYWALIGGGNNTDCKLTEHDAATVWKAMFDAAEDEWSKTA